MTAFIQLVGNLFLGWRDQAWTLVGHGAIAFHGIDEFLFFFRRRSFALEHLLVCLAEVSVLLVRHIEPFESILVDLFGKMQVAGLVLEALVRRSARRSFVS